MGDLTTDSAPMGTQPDYSFRENPRPNLNQRQPVRVFNITGSTGVHIGSVIHTSMPQPRPRVPPQDMPLQKDVDALRRCSREIDDRDKFVVSEHLGSAWKSLGRAMGFSPGQLDNLEADHPRSANQAYELLASWHDREAQHATVSRLTELLLAVRAYPVVKRLKP
ncbi:protein immune deficiency-like isoform X2 [Homarus americanus]|uniref:protein immune deficiency-like isoform X2 n=1 Tax=Homarus americanus TaxID=6706 RepID=UPI001C44DF5C|nr:protein immune deficiency-like isoform X2 [Homarus americanus]